MTPTAATRNHVIRTYIEPARLRGETTVQVRVGNVLKELGWTNRTPSVFSTLSSKAFMRDAGLELVEKRGGPSSGGPSTTVQFVYRLTRSSTTQSAEEMPKRVRNGEGLLALWGILAEEYRTLGGADAYIQSERNSWGPDPWEKLALESATAQSPKPGKSK